MDNPKSKILIVEDDATLGYLLKEYLSMNDFEIELADNSNKALKLLDTQVFDLAILDIMLPDIDGFELAKKIKNFHPNIPFIFLSARSLKVDVLKGFSLGAVDYLKKPIDEEELVVRIKALLNRINVNEEKVIQKNESKIGEYLFHHQNQELSINNEYTSLTKREADLLQLLLSNKNNLCTHKEILTALWGKSDYFNKKSLNVFITHLRKYLQKDPNITIENIHKQGFILKIKE